VTTPRDPETEAGRALLNVLVPVPTSGHEASCEDCQHTIHEERAENGAAILAIEDQLRAKLAAKVEGLREGSALIPGDRYNLGWADAWDAVLRLLRGDSGGAA